MFQTELAILSSHCVFSHIYIPNTSSHRFPQSGYFAFNKLHLLFASGSVRSTSGLSTTKQRLEAHPAGNLQCLGIPPTPPPPHPPESTYTTALPSSEDILPLHALRVQQLAKLSPRIVNVPLHAVIELALRGRAVRECHVHQPVPQRQ